jgi:hypothetical protein
MVKLNTLLWWDYSEGGSKWQARCLNFDRRKKVVKISRGFPYNAILETDALVCNHFLCLLRIQFANNST